MLAQVSWTEDVYCAVACDFVITVDFFCECINDVRKKCSCGQYCLMTTQEKQKLCCKLYVWLTMQNSASIFSILLWFICVLVLDSFLWFCFDSCHKGLNSDGFMKPSYIAQVSAVKTFICLFFVLYGTVEKKSHCSATTTNKAAALGVCLMWLLQPVPVARARRVLL